MGADDRKPGASLSILRWIPVSRTKMESEASARLGRRATSDDGVLAPDLAEQAVRFAAAVRSQLRLYGKVIIEEGGQFSGEIESGTAPARPMITLP